IDSAKSDTMSWFNSELIVAKAALDAAIEQNGQDLKAIVNGDHPSKDAKTTVDILDKIFGISSAVLGGLSNAEAFDDVSKALGALSAVAGAAGPVMGLVSMGLQAWADAEKARLDGLKDDAVLAMKEGLAQHMRTLVDNVRTELNDGANNAKQKVSQEGIWLEAGEWREIGSMEIEDIIFANRGEDAARVVIDAKLKEMIKDFSNDAAQAMQKVK
ncbi:MAG: hypothetical protein AAFS10_24795, partial [Myxococcota bacterium]